jgi:Tfp pilus assembly protein PilX
MSARAEGRERGSVMVLVILATLLITGMGITAMYLSSSAMKVTGNMTRRAEAFSTTESGREHAMAVLHNTPDWDVLLQGCGHPRDDTTTGGRGVVLCEGAVGLADIPMLAASSQAHASLSGLSNLTYTVFIRNNDMELSRGLRTDDQDQRVVLRIEGLARDGLSTVIIESPVLSTFIKVEDPYGEDGGGGQGGNSGTITMAHPAGSSSQP